MTEKNRRKSPRITSLPDCVVRVRFKNKKQFQQSYFKDICNNGIFLRTMSPRPVFEHVTVVLELPGEIQVELLGVVVHVVTPEQASAQHLPGMGVQFSDLNAEKRALLESFLKTKTVPPGTYAPGSPTVRPDVLPRRSGPFPLPAMSSGNDPTTALRRLLWLCVDATLLASCDAYELLGVSPDATVAEVRAASERLRALCDPSRPPAGLGESSRMRALGVVLLDLEDCLTRPERRVAYNATRAAKAK